MSSAIAVTKGAQTLWAGLPTVPQPLWATAAPLSTDAGAGVVMPYAVVKAQPAGEITWLADLDRIESVVFTVEMYHTSGSAADAACDAAQYGGRPPVERAGLDDAAALTLPAGYHLNKLERTGPAVVAQEKLYGSDANLVFKSTIPYRAEVYVTGDGS